MELPSFMRRNRMHPLDPQIDAIMSEMTLLGVSHEKYPTLLAHLITLNETKAKSQKSPISADTVVMVLGNLAGILLIVAYEQKHVLTSKGLTERLPLKYPNNKQI